MYAYYGLYWYQITAWVWALQSVRGRRSRFRVVVGFTTTYALSAYHHWCCEFEPRSGRSVQHYVIKFCQWRATGRWFSVGTPVSSANKTDRHDITEILLKVALNTITHTHTPTKVWFICFLSSLSENSQLYRYYQTYWGGQSEQL